MRPEPVDDIQLFSRWLEGTDIELFELTTKQVALRLRRDPADGSATSEASAVDMGSSTIPAPSVGIFRRSHPVRAAPLVRIGQRLQTGDPVGLLQIGSLLIHVLAPRNGTVLEIMVEDGAAVGYGTALVRLTEGGVQ